MKLFGFTGAARNAVNIMTERKGFALVIRGNEIFDCFLFESMRDAVDAKLYAKRHGFVTGEGYVIREASGDKIGDFTVIKENEVVEYFENEEKAPLTDRIPERGTLEWALYVQNHYTTDFFVPKDLFEAGQLVERFNLKNKIYELVSGAFHNKD